MSHEAFVAHRLPYGASMREGQRTRQTKRDTARATTNCVDIRAPALSPRALTQRERERASEREREKRRKHTVSSSSGG
jgi:hypothetical protein